jgi:hypothetical protein
MERGTSEMEIEMKEFKIRGRLQGGDTFDGFVKANSKAEAKDKCENNHRITSWEFKKN